MKPWQPWQNRPREATLFSRRIPPDLTANRIARALAEHGTPRYDLSVSNPTRCGIPYPPDLLAPLADEDGLVYHPTPLGLEPARAAVARELTRHGAAVEARRIVLTASTSEAYAFLFKLLCDPGETVLAPLPSYPLFEHLASAEGVALHPYRLDPDHGWRFDPSELATAPPSTRAVIVVHPNNPTGSFVQREDATALMRLCSRRGWALIADEVFLDYPLDGQPRPSLAASADALTFVLGGLSKSVGLPQLKLAWIVASGPSDMVDAALERLEVVADTFLSVSTPVQLAAPRLLAEGAAVREAVVRRLRDNLDILTATVAPIAELQVLTPEGGWSAVLRFPNVAAEEDLVLELLHRDDVAVHPGYFFDFPREGYLVVSLLVPTAVLGEGAARLVARIGTLL